MKKEIKELSNEELNCVDGGNIFDDLAAKAIEREKAKGKMVPSEDQK